VIKPNFPGLTVYGAIFAGLTAETDTPTTVAEDGAATDTSINGTTTTEPRRDIDFRENVMICNYFLKLGKLSEGRKLGWAFLSA